MMKKIYTLLIALFFVGGVVGQGCLPEGIIFNTQEQIDNFQNNYPNCTEIIGNVLIWENSNENITNLNGINMLISIGGDLTIKFNDALTSLTGLDNLESIGGKCEIIYNHSLNNLTGLEGLTSVSNDIKIANNNVLTTLAGLEDLTYIGGEVEIRSSPSLLSLTGLESLISIPESLTISGNDALTNLSGLDNVISVGGNLMISHNDSLTSIIGLNNLSSVGGLFIDFNLSLATLSGLNSLTSIGGNLRVSYSNITDFIGLDNLTSIYGSITINDNYVLGSLIGLDSIDEGNIYDLSIYNNTSLSTCDVTWLCDYLANPNGSVKIYNNATGCDNPSEIALSCGIILPCLPFGHYYFTSQIYIDDFPSNFPGCVELKGDVKILESDEITNVNGLNQITSIEGALDILNNEALTSLTGFENLTYIGGALGLHSNNSLTSLEGLDNVDGFSMSYLYIGNNILLSICNVQSICDYLSIPNNEAYIFGNDIGCYNIIEVEQACEIYSVDELNKILNINIYPIPTQSSITVELPAQPSINTSLSISNTNGQQLITQAITEPQTEINIRQLPAGIYIVKVWNDKDVMVQKVIKR